MSGALTINGLVKTYKGSDKPAVNGLTLTVQPGEVFGLLGPNGAGKTTTLRIVCGLLSYDGGEVRMFGHDASKQTSELKKLMGVVPQDIALYPTLSAWENLLIFGGIHQIKYSELKQRIDYLLDLFGLLHHKNRKVSDYSGGMKRRINLIAGLLHRPAILFLDEPTVGIDVQSKNVIIENLKQINQQGTTIIYTSHYMEEAEQLCTRVAIVDEGAVIAQGTPAELISRSETYRGLEDVYLDLTGKHLRD